LTEAYGPVQLHPNIQTGNTMKAPRNPEIHVDIDLIDRCNLQCPTCWRGVGAQVNTSATLPLDEFRAIIRKVKAEGFENVALINWTEPFLCTTLHKYVPIVVEAGLDSWLSSNLSLNPKIYLPTILAALEAGVDILFVSVSGFTQSIYEINHVGGRIDWIFENLTAIAEGMKAGRIKTGVYVRYLEFPYNSHEGELWRTFTEKLGMGIFIVPAHGNPYDPLPSYEGYQQHVKDRLSGLRIPDPAEEIPAERLDVSEKICSLIADRVAIDAKGDAYLCCAYPNVNEVKIGAYTEISEHDMLLRRISHPFCDRCAIPRRDSTPHDRERVAIALAKKKAHAAA
jgi:hypothetical protein